jgi:hypothetical protein
MRDAGAALVLPRVVAEVDVSLGFGGFGGFGGRDGGVTSVAGGRHGGQRGGGRCGHRAADLFEVFL